MPHAARTGARPRPWGFIGLAAFVAVTIALLFVFAPNRQPPRDSSADLSEAEALPDTVPKGTVLVVGDPVTQWVFEHLGWDKKLPFTVKWVQITGGPDVTEAFHAKALDVGLGANVPPIHATWVGLPVRIVAFRQRRDPLAHPAFVLAIAPKARIRTLADLRGKRIAFSPSQVQSQVVLQTLKALGLTRKDVKLVELPSSIGGDVYTSALASNLVDVAPIGSGIVAERYLRKFGQDGAKVIPHPEFRDDALVAYVPTEVVHNPAKAAALKQFFHWWGRAQAWQQTHRDELSRGYYVDHQGLSLADAKLIIAAIGDIDVARGWDQPIAYQQAAIDLLAPEMDQPRFDAATLFDRRFEEIAANGFAAGLAADR
ncbi:ABC transporter substrate-binding protein [Sphingomonas sp. So64.6b]|uniref:ABC transporter substrate-binding protein n=1 Tax=Sphingomonas sp. So64.6b TaxID=2997354 RepID=UPI00160083B1|nr:ABC transporter substrate-binding protein [Sphingomonas sp. So64.6b]QNA86463.1 ABC transporter substrate-binding protein [Sphingomonas sp. So64.6b]